MSEHPIATLLQALTDDETEKIIIKLISEGHLDDELLQKILQILEKQK